MTKRGVIIAVLLAAGVGAGFAAYDYSRYTRYSETDYLMKFFAEDGAFTDPTLSVGSMHGMTGEDPDVKWICFSDTPPALFKYAAAAPDPMPPKGPVWLGCYDADQIAADLADGNARAYALQTFDDPDMIFVAAVYPTGSGAMWVQRITEPLVRPVVQP
jgi:hypothetical protein